MRLSSRQFAVLQKLSKNVKWDFYLFWSRLDDNKKWGDIDINYY